MTINDIINGPEGAQNSPKQQNVGIQMPANNSYQQSLYIAAISKSLGYEGLISPVSEVWHGVEHTFDFYDPEAEQLFKVFPAFDERQYAQYAKYHGRPFIILDSAGVSHEIKDCECGCEYMQVTDAKIAKRIYRDQETVIFHDGNLWKFRGFIDGEWTWKKIMPVVLQEFVEEVDDEEEDEDDED